MARSRTTRRGIQYRRDRRRDRRHQRHHGPSLQPNQNQQYGYRQGGHFLRGQQQDLQRETVSRASGTPESSRVFSINETISIGRTFRIGETNDTSRTNR
uniref:Uncharacterized protein n=1 Tax=Anguilla anguilla TaxID=7936 RepID=A0A0E9XSN6_ANGAN